MRRTGADFHVVRLQKRAALGAPILLEGENDLLEGQHGFGKRRTRPGAHAPAARAASGFRWQKQEFNQRAPSCRSAALVGPVPRTQKRLPKQPWCRARTRQERLRRRLANAAPSASKPPMPTSAHGALAGTATAGAARQLKVKLACMASHRGSRWAARCSPMPSSSWCPKPAA